MNRDIPYKQWEWSPDDSDLQPLGIEDFQLQFIFLGGFCSIALLINLGELLLSPDNFYMKKYKLVLCGLAGCLYVACVNLGVFLILVLTNDLEINWELAEGRKDVAFTILGFGAVTSFLFTIGCLVKYLGF